MRDAGEALKARVGHGPLRRDHVVEAVVREQGVVQGREQRLAPDRGRGAQLRDVEASRGETLVESELACKMLKRVVSFAWASVTKLSTRN